MYTFSPWLLKRPVSEPKNRDSRRVLTLSAMSFLGVDVGVGVLKRLETQTMGFGSWALGCREVRGSRSLEWGGGSGYGGILLRKEFKQIGVWAQPL